MAERRSLRRIALNISRSVQRGGEADHVSSIPSPGRTLPSRSTPATTSGGGAGKEHRCLEHIRMAVASPALVIPCCLRERPGAFGWASDAASGRPLQPGRQGYPEQFADALEHQRQRYCCPTPSFPLAGL